MHIKQHSYYSCRVAFIYSREYRNGGLSMIGIDGFYEVEDKAYIFCDFSMYTNSSLTNLVDDLSRSGKIVILLKCKGDLNHDIHDTSKSIADGIYFNKHWYKINGGTVKDFTDKFLQFVNTLGELDDEIQQ